VAKESNTPLTGKSEALISPPEEGRGIPVDFLWESTGLGIPMDSGEIRMLGIPMGS